MISTDEEMPNTVTITPPPQTCSPIGKGVNKHLDFANKVLEEGRKIAKSNVKVPATKKRIKCLSCDKAFLRINTHKCKGYTNKLI